MERCEYIYPGGREQLLTGDSPAESLRSPEERRLIRDRSERRARAHANKGDLGSRAPLITKATNILKRAGGAAIGSFIMSLEVSGEERETGEPSEEAILRDLVRNRVSGL